MAMRLQYLYGKQLVLISCGAFYTAIGTDAVILNKELGLKTICAKKGFCKIGIPIGSIEKYLKKLDEADYGYIVLDFDKEKKEITERFKKLGNIQKENVFNRGCDNCSSKRNFEITIYEEALNKYFNKKFGEECQW